MGLGTNKFLCKKAVATLVKQNNNWSIKSNFYTSLISFLTLPIKL